jgi:hypothetical protein
MAQTNAGEAAAELPRFSLVGEDPWQRAQRRLRLIPPDGPGIGRRIAALVLTTWGVLMVLAVIENAPLVTGAGEPLLRHFGVHARCLWAIPLMVLAEAVVEQRFSMVIAHFVRSGLVRSDTLADFRAALRGAERLSDSKLAFAAILGLALTAAVLGATGGMRADELSWATVHGTGSRQMSLAGTWYMTIVRPLFVVLLLRWLWRLVVATARMRRLARLDLELVPTHADRSAGLAFLEELPIAFVPVVLALSGVLAARLGHDVLYHELHVGALKLPVGTFVVLMLAAFLAPLVAFAPRLARLKRSASFAYSGLVSRHGRLVRRRWIDGDDAVSDELLSAPEIGPVADTIPIYETVAKMRIMPFGRRPVIMLALAVALPFLPVAAIEIPLRQVLLKLGGALL